MVHAFSWGHGVCGLGCPQPFFAVYSEFVRMDTLGVMASHGVFVGILVQFSVARLVATCARRMVPHRAVDPVACLTGKVRKVFAKQKKLFNKASVIQQGLTRTNQFTLCL